MKLRIGNIGSTSRRAGALLTTSIVALALGGVKAGAAPSDNPIADFYALAAGTANQVLPGADTAHMVFGFTEDEVCRGSNPYDKMGYTFFNPEQLEHYAHVVINVQTGLVTNAQVYANPDGPMEPLTLPEMQKMNPSTAVRLVEGANLLPPPPCGMGLYPRSEAFENARYVLIGGGGERAVSVDTVTGRVSPVNRAQLPVVRPPVLAAP
jgi:hypothetical protein